ncbi:MAG: hypothetical protein A3E84_00550 [Gammaproteobacteria bacterium RIFCSPHIGHO2_12_FULL_42_13]|nr:MAG: hypothetical protein A3E84_00550 [Gammaproteobacteria bacterium RIFCSPHIGHO2_12_FULL_42_13]
MFCKVNARPTKPPFCMPVDPRLAACLPKRVVLIQLPVSCALNVTSCHINPFWLRASACGLQLHAKE